MTNSTRNPAAAPGKGMKVKSAPVSRFRRSTVRFGNVPRLLPA